MLALPLRIALRQNCFLSCTNSRKTGSPMSRTRSKMRRRFKALSVGSLLLLLSSQACPVYARTSLSGHHRPPLPPVPASAASALDKIASELWLRSRSQLQFCFGSSQQRAEGLLRDSFALPWPAGHGGICSSTEEVEKGLCTPDDMMFYYKV